MQSVEHDKPCELCLKIKFDGVKDDPSAVACSRCEKPFHLSCLGVDKWRQAVADVHSFACHNCGNSEFTYDHLHLPLFSPDKIRFKDTICQFVRRDDFSKPEDLPLKVFSGETEADALTMKSLEEEGFKKPVLVWSKQYLGMTFPDNLDRKLIESQLGTLRQIQVINTDDQTVNATYLEKFNDYFFNDTNPGPILCSLSLELSRTKFRDEFIAPAVVRSMDWGVHFFKRGELKEYTDRFLQQCMPGSFVDFNIDGGGSSIWHHICKGKEVLYLIKPLEGDTDEIKRFTIHDDDYPGSFFKGEQTPPMQCYRIEVEEGQTVFIPGGFIRASYYPVRTVIFGGNFLNIYNADIQLRCFNMEEELKVRDEYRFPCFKKLHWCLANLVPNRKADDPLTFSRHKKSLTLIKNELCKWVHDQAQEGTYKTLPTTTILTNFANHIASCDPDDAEDPDDPTATGGEPSGNGSGEGSSHEAGEIAESFSKMSPSRVYPPKPKRLFRLVPYSDSEDEESDN